MVAVIVVACMPLLSWNIYLFYYELVKVDKEITGS